jgi:hypothetical protein
MFKSPSSRKKRTSGPVGAVTLPDAPKRPVVRRRLTYVGATLLLVMGSALGADELVWRGAHAAAIGSAVSAILDPGAIFAARSPGARGSGPLLQTKHERESAALHAPAPPGGPEERVLAGIRELPAAPYYPAGGRDSALVQPIADVPSFAPAEAPPGFGPAFSSPGGPMAGPAFLDSPPSGGTPGDGLPPGGGISAVPEPSDWMLMILALFGVGAVLRRRRSMDLAADRVQARSNA